MTRRLLAALAALDAAGALGADTQVVTITIGANDLGWQQVLLACSNVGTPLACEIAMAQLAQALADLGPKLAAVYTAVREAAPEALILFTGYPILFGPFEGTCHIGNLGGTPVVVGEDQGEAALDAVNTLNGIIRGTVIAIAGAGDPNVGYVDVSTAFMSHALCDTSDRWISGFVRGDPMIARSLHPNTGGQQAYAAILAPIVGAALAG